MICKHCGAEMAPSAHKCKRCGTKVPAKSDCGGFYDLASAGTKLWEDSKPAAAAPSPTPVYREAPPPVPVHHTRPFMILTVVAAVLAIALLVSLLTKCSSDEGAAPVYTPTTQTEPTEPSTGDPTEPGDEDNNSGITTLPPFAAENTTIEIYQDGYKITSSSPQLVYPYLPALDPHWEWAPDQEDPENKVALTVTVDVDETIFGAVDSVENEDGSKTESIEYRWERAVGEPGDKLKDLNDDFTADANTLICERDDDLFKTYFTLTITRYSNSGGVLTVVISGIPYPEEGVPVPEPEPEPEQDPNSAPLDGTNDSQQTGTGDQETNSGDQGTGDQVSADVFN